MNIFQKINRELKWINFAIFFSRKSKELDKDRTITLADQLEKQCTKTPSNIAIEFDDQKISYQELDNRANKIANWAIENGYKTGDVVSLLMENKPEYIIFWYGFAKVGVTIALLNSNIKGKSLAHCINTSKCNAVFVDSDLVDNFSTSESEIDGSPEVFMYGKEVQGFKNFDDEINTTPESRPSRECRKGLLSTDPFQYVYTSGTTGMPKASKFSHFRFIASGSIQYKSLNMTAESKNLMVLPLYHATGGAIGVTSVLLYGGCLVLRRKFSAEKFWEECVKYNVTHFTYIGEMLRYLVNTKPSEYEKKHNVSGILGNGLRPDVWKEVQSRFNINHIVEFYGSSEGNINLFNIDSRFGAIGRVPSYLKKLMNIKIIKFDVDNEKHIRSENGYCIECDNDEAGEAIGQIPDDDTVRGKFEGYTNEEATNKKILKDVFEKGDRWFTSGDLLKKDKEGYIYFVDRIGDTFRWKSENVATSEVSEAISAYQGIKEANVYGVLVPKQDGRAGMASIVTSDDFNIDGFYEYLNEQLPKYSIPVFIRISPEIEKTGTFKYKKTDLAKEGFDPQVVKEPLYFASGEENKYIILDTNLFVKINNQEVRI